MAPQRCNHLIWSCIACSHFLALVFDALDETKVNFALNKMYLLFFSSLERSCSAVAGSWAHLKLNQLQRSKINGLVNSSITVFQHPISHDCKCKICFHGYELMVFFPPSFGAAQPVKPMPVPRTMPVVDPSLLNNTQEGKLFVWRWLLWTEIQSHRSQQTILTERIEPHFTDMIDRIFCS